MREHHSKGEGYLPAATPDAVVFPASTDEVAAIVGREFQWTHERAVFHFPAAARVFSFELRSIAPSSQTVTVLLDGTEADRLKLVDHDWHPQRYSLPQRPSTRRYRRVELLVSPVMRPSNDPRTLGVQLSRVTWMR